MKTTFDLPDALVRKAKAKAAQEGRPLRDLVAEAIDEKLLVEPSETTDGSASCDSRREAWQRWKARLVRESDGTWTNPSGIDDPSFFETLTEIRRESWGTRDGADVD